MQFVDLSGQRFGRWTVVEFAGMDKYSRALWRCVCDCGKMDDVASNNLRRGLSKSCGCYKSDISKQIHTTHGQCNTRLYKIWQGMKRRCYNPHEIRYNRYGGKNVSLCEEWASDFAAFADWAMNNGYNDSLSIDRLDPHGNYSPSNCRWVTVIEQANNKTNNLCIEYNGEVHTLGEWAKITGINYKTLHTRYSRGDRGVRLFRK